MYLMVTVMDRRRLRDFISLYRLHQVYVNMIALGHGTASGEVLSLLGLTGSERALALSVVTEQTWKSLKRDLEQKIRIDIPGTGIAFTVPMSSIGGKRELRFMVDGQNWTKGEESVMQGTNRELLIVISNQGYNELVMDAAREAGAHGGTVLHARGTGMERAEKFLGISLAAEKDITLIVTKTAGKNAIMKSVMEKAGMETQAQSIVFSLPVTSTAGLRLLDQDDEPTPPEASAGTENK
ncbi:MAG: P-II family nitrogen regulator [Oscillospiraceae bacterium]|nr:P-II family nitrogen regulator [Oscillospiraceae bacterium]